MRGAERARGECLSRGSPKPGALNPAGRRCGAGAVAPREEISHEPDNTAGLGSDIGQVVSEAGAPGGRLSSARSELPGTGACPLPSRSSGMYSSHHLGRATNHSDTACRGGAPGPGMGQAPWLSRPEREAVSWPQHLRVLVSHCSIAYQLGPGLNNH